MTFFSTELENLGVILGFGAGHGAEAGLFISCIIIFSFVVLLMILGVKNIWSLMLIEFPFYLIFLVLGWMPIWTLLIFVFMLIIILGVKGTKMVTGG